MKVLKISYLDNPPKPYVSWTENAIKSLLVTNGFNLDKEITRCEDAMTYEIMFYQKESNDCTPK